MSGNETITHDCPHCNCIMVMARKSLSVLNIRQVEIKQKLEEMLEEDYELYEGACMCCGDTYLLINIGQEKEETEK